MQNVRLIEKFLNFGARYHKFQRLKAISKKLSAKMHNLLGTLNFIHRVVSVALNIRVLRKDTS